LAVIAILARIAVPALHNFMMSNSMTSANNQLVASLNYARNQAIAQRAKVLLCKTANPQATTPTCDTGSGTSYDEGWVVYNQYPQSGATVTNVMKVVVPNSISNITIKGSSKIASKIEFNLLGTLLDPADGVTALTNNVYLALCDTRQWARSGQYARVITINPAGQVTSLLGNDTTQKNVTSCSP
jgi:Tfp pilus assembly protein FimT